MAHHCYHCGVKCHCGGDIDDLILGEADHCIHCKEDADFDEDKFYFCHTCDRPESVCECKDDQLTPY